MKITLKDMEILKLEKGDVVIIRPKECCNVDTASFHKGLADASKKTGIRFLAADMVDVSVIRKDPDV